ncbi:tat pathway signal sequence [Hypoxylon crocopeplum]|nr:tat pathway signal sequence [Hypoxylon crocopeplum]
MNIIFKLARVDPPWRWPSKPMEKYHRQIDAESTLDSEASSEALLHEERLEKPEHGEAQPALSRRAIIIHFFVFLVYSIVIIAIFLSSRSQCYCDLVYSPAREAASQYSVVTFDAPLHGDSVFRGAPREELHAAWSELLQYHNIRVPESDLRRINRTSLPLNDDDGGFLVTLDVFHQLHCLNQLRQQIYHEYYYPGVDNWNTSKRFEHVDHCIDVLRQVLMCQGDVSLLTYSWIDGYRRPWPNFEVDHTCRDWNSIVEWARENNIPSLKGPILLHPVLGPAWPEDDHEDHE